MQDMPSPSVILDLVIAHVNDIDTGSARAKFEMRMAVAALQLVQRSIQLQPGADVNELSRLRTLLNDSNAGLEQLNRQLCARIRDGEPSLPVGALEAHMRQTTMEKLAIDQPTYAAYRRALEKTEG